jgi:septum site-determining protein MinC
MLSGNAIKLNSANFEYYILQVNEKTRMEQIKTKLLELKKLDSNSVIVLKIADEVDINNATKIASNVNEMADATGINLHSILRNTVLTLDNIIGIPVIDFPSTTKCKNINSKTLTHSDPVRSGMRIEHDGDIIITSFVSENAEVVSAGNIHIYGNAKGRLIAGSNGDKTAKIFATKFDAQIIAIGGIYRVLEAPISNNIQNKSVMILLDEKERLNIVPID